jgi:hypothetical protein
MGSLSAPAADRSDAIAHLPVLITVLHVNRSCCFAKASRGKHIAAQGCYLETSCNPRGIIGLVMLEVYAASGHL